MLSLILSKLLLIIGICFFFSSIINIRNRVISLGREQTFASTIAQTTYLLIALLLALLAIPTTLYTYPSLFNPKTLNYNNNVKEPIIYLTVTIIVFIITIVLVTVCTKYLIRSINPLIKSTHLSYNFISLILIPIVCNTAEHITVIVIAIYNKIDITIGAILNKLITLHFKTFKTVALIVLVLVAMYTVQDSKSNYLEGAILLSLYCIIALALYTSPTNV
ncbi:Vacuolar calcium ion transporter [Colletotrichum tanaceti]|uniref:Vacuolar calcium ion transporter n=1 Tax=Colletotrichum tanaceti TaxID=1306861 RepID=A0A4U6XGG5_9PEZI|nr:Vacuolar calcium ion transporter [Colletotrichum tanaceti]TKW54684.1 Vacuolar calcium ion transporter [Colletotrichum tanaceti]